MHQFFKGFIFLKFSQQQRAVFVWHPYFAV